MSIHSSLRSSSKGKKHRSVLKRHERLKVLKEKDLWSEEKSVLGLQKVKMQKLKVRKEKAAAAETPEGQPAAAAGTGAAPASAPAGAQAKAPAKGEKK